MSTHDEPITIYSDYVCPFCYLGRRSLEAYLDSREQDIEIAWHPFDLRSRKRGPDGEIDHSIDDGKDDAYYERVQENVARLREEYSADEMLNLDDLPDAVDSLPAQVAAFYVQEEYPDQWGVFDEAIFEALWVEGRDIGDADVVVDIAEDVGLDVEEIRGVLADDEVRGRLRELFSEAHDAGVSAVPTFVYDDYVARGAVPPRQLERLVEGP